jgi:RHH-type rel operon transcriptional repressor/antitoxin RelB
MVAIRLPPEIENRLDALAKATGRSKAYYVREAIIEYLGDLEDLYLAQRRLDDLKTGRSTTVSLEDVAKRYGLED